MLPPIDFSPDRWSRVMDDTERWWRGELDRPLIQFTLLDDLEVGPEPSPYFPLWPAFYDDSTPPDLIVDHWQRHLASLSFLGDAFPHVWLNYGPGVGAAMLGATLHATPAQGTVWFEPEEVRPLSELHFAFDPDNRWFRRIAALMRAATDRWNGTVQVGQTDLGGNLDLLSTFRPSEELLTDLYDDPAAVRRLTWELHECWWRIFTELNRSALRPGEKNPGYSCWTPLVSRSPYYMLQCDFCYMIGPAMFDEFVRPELAATAARLGGRAFYHLDGVGQLAHLDSLLSIPDLRGVQWVAGDGEQAARDWTDVYRRIRAAGKLAQVAYLDLDGISRLVDDLGEGGRGLYFHCGLPASERPKAEAFCRRHGVPLA